MRKNKSIEAFNEQHPRNAEVHIVNLPIASRRERRQQAKKDSVPFVPQYNYLAPFTIADRKERTNKLMQWLNNSRKHPTNG